MEKTFKSMRLLFITQIVDKDDAVLGFTHGWLSEFAKHYEKVTVICLKEGKHDLPANVSVYSLGKETEVSRFKYLKNFFKYIFSLKNEYDTVFVHMNYIYVLLGGFFWRSWGKKIGLWYVHRQTSFGLWVSEKFANIIFTSAPESFRLKSKKLIYVGHGVDKDVFSCVVNEDQNNEFNIIHVGRITPIKHIETLIQATNSLKNEIPNLSVKLIGVPTSSVDYKYQDTLRSLSDKLSVNNLIQFKGNVPNRLLTSEYCKASISVNMTPTGGWDKSVIESLMCGCPVFASNKSLKEVFGEYSDLFLFKFQDAGDLSEKIKNWSLNLDKQKIINKLMDQVRTKYDYRVLISKIVDKLK
jgi:glycosyltransferase involved in cell wall biosynthesis